MATEGASGDESPIQIIATSSHGSPDRKSDFDMDNLSRPELLTLLSIMEGELEARDLVIEALRARRKEVFIQERYGRFSLGDPFLALQRDYEASAGIKEKKSICSSPIQILEAIMAHCKKMQERMSAQLAAAEKRQNKLEMEKSSLQSLQQEHKKLSLQLEEERTKNKHIVIMLVNECKQLASKIVEETQKMEEAMVTLEEEKKKTCELENSLVSEKQKSAQMEAQMEKQLSEFDTEREQLRAKLSREEVRAADLREELNNMKKIIEQLKIENEMKTKLPVSKINQDKCFTSVAVGTEVPSLHSFGCQTDAIIVDSSFDSVKRPLLTAPVKPSTVNPLMIGNIKVNPSSNMAYVKPSCHDSHAVLPTMQVTPPNQHRLEENGTSIASSSDLINSPYFPASPVFCSPPTSVTASSAFTPTAHATSQSLHSPSASGSAHPVVSPRVQAARYKFQGNVNEYDQNGTGSQSPPSRDLSPSNRDHMAAKQIARNTVTQVLSRFTSPQGGSTLRPGVPHSGEGGAHSPTGTRLVHPPGTSKSPTVTRVDRGNPPPIPPKKPGLSQTPSHPHPQLKVIMEGSRSQTGGLKIENKVVTSPSSGSSQGNRVANEDISSKPAPSKLPPKPTLDIPVASTGCAITAMATSQVGAWPPSSPGLNQPACSESFPVISTTTSTTTCSSFINPVSASSCRPCDSDSLLVTVSGWSSSLTPSLTSGGPAPLGDRPTLLQQAAAQGNVTLLSMLLNEEGMDINYIHEDSFPALYSAAKNGHTDCVELLLSAGAHVDVTDKNGLTPLSISAAHGHFRCLELLIDHNAEVNHPASGGQTPLYFACASGNNECVQLLLEAGAHRDILTNDGWTPIHSAAYFGNADSLRLLMHYGAVKNSSVILENEDTASEVEPIISTELLNYPNKDGWTAAHMAASKGFKDCLEILCGHIELDTERRDNWDRTIHDVATDDCKHLLEKLNHHKVLLKVSLCAVEHICCGVEQSESEIAICTLNIYKQTSWHDLHMALSDAVMSHFRTVFDGWGTTEESAFNNTAESNTDLTGTVFASARIGNTLWFPGTNMEFSVWDLLKKDKVGCITMFLSGLQEGCPSGLAYASLIPLQTLQNYLRLVEQYQNVIFHGPEGSLQDYIAYHIALCLKQKQEVAGFSCEIVKIEVDAEFPKEQLLKVFICSGFLTSVKQLTGNRRVIVILQNLEKASCLSEFLGDFLAPLENRGVGNSFTLHHVHGVSDAYHFQENSYLIGTVAKSHLHGSDLLVQQHFRWVQLRWDREPIRNILERHLKRKVINKFKGKMPPPSDPVLKIVKWICAVWHQINSCLSRLGTPEALIGPKDFLSCPIVPGQVQITTKWMTRLWDAVIAPRVEEAVLRASTMRSPVLGRSPVHLNLSHGQQALVKAALCILLNKAVLHGCPLPRPELDLYAKEFHGGHFNMSVISNHKSDSKKKGDGSSWRKASTTPRKKLKGLQSWNSQEKHNEDANPTMDFQKHCKKIMSMKQTNVDVHHPRVMDLKRTLSVDSDDDIDLIEELHSMCSSKSEPDISKPIDVE
ncbi:cortactin-binding protein 2 isoform X2 [Protopterus annectens]|uniref:cortactin-binding protein 2 isoform X2 n=1 Tax=Protopterus annectens TaxID=7888 RepID=UPI001CFBBCA2|nr:cortactin-binding protein 2 isoform X2 [Protopterus annectens]XP_043944659.1 cortactin-binding protein 2 isoform X2 [Protopterus annectens]